MTDRVLIVSHDAGGAEILSAWCEEKRERYDFAYCLEGPAAEIFERDFGHLAGSDLGAMDTLGERDIVLTGSSLEASLEREAIHEAKSLGVHCVTFIDHWDLYRERFDKNQNGDLGLPDEVWVGDEYAYAYAVKVGFPDHKLKLVPNPYFAKIRSQRKGRLKDKADKGVSVLYICEPISRKLMATFGQEAVQYDDEITIIEKFLASSCQFADRVDRITLRLHPSEPRAKYEKVLDRYHGSLPVHLSKDRNLVDDICEHSVVVGIESMGLVVALVLEKQVYSCITGRPWKISLPQKEINRINGFNAIFESVPSTRWKNERMNRK